MTEKLKPYMYVDDIYNIDYDRLKKEGIRGLIFDIDNTLIPYEESIPRETMINLFDDLREMGFAISLASNGPKKRVEQFNIKLELFALHRSWKPLVINIKKAMKDMKLSKEEVAIVGDQIFTDVLAGNRAGIKTILVKPICPKKNIVEKTKRNIENILLQKFNKNT